MINIKQLTGDDVGRWVKYTGYAGEVEHGKIKSWNDSYVFVVYKCAGEWGNFKNYTGAATNPSQLEFDDDWCPICEGEGWVPVDESDGEGHIQAGVGREPCHCQILNN